MGGGKNSTVLVDIKVVTYDRGAYTRKAMYIAQREKVGGGGR